MYNRLITGLALSISLLLSSSTASPMQPRVPNTTETVRIIGAAIAIAGIAALAHGTIRGRTGSFLGGLLLLGGGTAATLNAERIVEETNRATGNGWLDRAGRALEHRANQFGRWLSGE